MGAPPVRDPQHCLAGADGRHQPIADRFRHAHIRAATAYRAGGSPLRVLARNSALEAAEDPKGVGPYGHDIVENPLISIACEIHVFDSGAGARRRVEAHPHRCGGGWIELTWRIRSPINRLGARSSAG
jgi:hypothetical protein